MLMWVLRVGPLVPIPSLMTWTMTSWPRLKMVSMGGGRMPPSRQRPKAPRPPPAQKPSARAAPSRPPVALPAAAPGRRAVLLVLEVGEVVVDPGLGRAFVRRLLDRGRFEVRGSLDRFFFSHFLGL